jgi:hypothetical protein
MRISLKDSPFGKSRRREGKTDKDAIDESTKKAFDVLLELVKQGITLAIAIITVTAAFVKNIVGDPIDTTVKSLVLASWGLFLVSVLCGFVVILVLSKMLFRSHWNPGADISLKRFGYGQTVSFLSALMLALLASAWNIF